jgi:peptidoglycan/xylan/chitin deacetylase (PgdA/CDA1 family)
LYARPIEEVGRSPLPVLRSCVAALAGHVLRLSARRAGIVLVYHGLASRTGDADRELVAPHGSELFEAQLRHLARNYRVVSAAELPRAVARRRRGERFPAAITFDDDLASHLTLALPILRRIGVHGTFFLTGATLRGPFAFWWPRLEMVGSDQRKLAELSAALGAAVAAVPPPRTLQELGRLVEWLEPEARDAFAAHLEVEPLDAGLQERDVRALVEAGMAIGFHTRRHDVLTNLDERRLANAFEEGRRQLEEVMGSRLTVVAYPHGRGDERVAAAASRAGFEVGFTGVARAVRADNDTLLLGRLSPSHRSAGHLALQIVAALFRARAD